MTEWQPIETAPKDGTEILVCFRCKDVRQVSWQNPFSDDAEFASWCVDDGKHGPLPLRGYKEGEAAHWMPLPEPPTE